MSEKRFVYHEEHFPLNVREIIDNEIGETYDCEGATDVLNELFDENKQLKEENEQLKKSEKINMDYAEQIVEENQKLRISKNDFRREKEQFQKENEQLRKELDNFSPVMFQDMRKGTVILYSKKFGNNDEVSDEKDAIIQRLALENENLRKQVKSSETTSDATSNYNAHLESKITTLEKENEQLHLAIEDLLTHTSCEEVKKENSNLRQNIMIIKDLLSECDLFSDKATKHDIIAYKEMRQFDNKDAYCICTAIKKAIEKLKRCNDE